jgi:hypothetical protein
VVPGGSGGSEAGEQGYHEEPSGLVAVRRSRSGSRHLCDAGAQRRERSAREAVAAWVEVIGVRWILVINLLRFLLKLEVNAVEIFLDPHRPGLVDHDLPGSWLFVLVSAIAPWFRLRLSAHLGLSLRVWFLQFLTGDAVAVGVEIGKPVGVLVKSGLRFLRGLEVVARDGGAFFFGRLAVCI